MAHLMKTPSSLVPSRVVRKLGEDQSHYYTVYLEGNRLYKISVVHSVDADFDLEVYDHHRNLADISGYNDDSPDIVYWLIVPKRSGRFHIEIECDFGFSKYQLEIRELPRPHRSSHEYEEPISSPPSYLEEISDPTK